MICSASSTAWANPSAASAASGVLPKSSFNWFGIFPIPLAAIAVRLLQELVDRQLLLLDLVVQLGDRLGLLHRRVVSVR